MKTKRRSTLTRPKYNPNMWISSALDGSSQKSTVRGMSKNQEVCKVIKKNKKSNPEPVLFVVDDSIKTWRNGIIRSGP